MTKDKDSVFGVIRRHWYEAPVDVEQIIRDSGLIYREADLDPEISGMVEHKGPDLYAITVNRRDSRARRRFTAAHELGHYIYHRDLIGDGVDDSRAYRSIPAGRYYNRQITSRHETQANQFAANLLMPRHLITELNRQGVTTEGDLAKALGVSVPAMRVRLGKEPYPSGVEEFAGAEDDEDDGGLAPLTGPTF